MIHRRLPIVRALNHRRWMPRGRVVSRDPMTTDRRRLPRPGRAVERTLLIRKAFQA
jgi:hypothetical protein